MKRKSKIPQSIRIGHRVWDSMAQASGQSGIPLSCLKYLKRHGCPCFKFHRVYERGLQKYVDDYIWNNRAFWIGGRMKERLRESKAALKRMYPDWKP